MNIFPRVSARLATQVAIGLMASALCLTLGASAAKATPQLVFSQDFSSGTAGAQFSGAGSVVDAQGYKGNGGFADNFLRNDTGLVPNTTTASPTVLTLTGLPAHDSISLNFLLAIIDSWDGNALDYGPDSFNVTVDGTSIYSETFTNFPSFDTQTASTANRVIAPSKLGFNSSYADSGYDMGQLAAFQNIPHTASTLTVEWFASGPNWGGGLDESFALDNVQVTVNTSSVPEPGTTALLAIGLTAALAGLSLVRREGSVRG